MKNAIILCSGGLDSVVCSHHVRKKLNYKKIILLFFNYRQRALELERKYSKNCAKDVNAEFKEISLPEIKKLLNSSLTNKLPFRKINKTDLKDTKEESKNWYVPCRNLIFLSYALALAESLYISKKQICDIFVGFKSEGKESFPDATKEFVEAINKLSKISCAKPFAIKAPLIKKDKEDIILLGKKLGVNFRKTFSCYTGKKLHCGQCLACRLRQAGFYWANVKDPTQYGNG